MLASFLNDLQELSAVLRLAVGAVVGHIEMVPPPHRVEFLQTLPNGSGEAVQVHPREIPEFAAAVLVGVAEVVLVVLQQVSVVESTSHFSKWDALHAKIDGV